MEEKQEKEEFKGKMGIVWLTGILVIILGCVTVYTFKLVNENKKLKQAPAQVQQTQTATVQEQPKEQDKIKNTQKETNNIDESKKISNTRELNESEKKKIEDEIKTGGDFYSSLFSIQSNNFKEIKKFDTNLLKNNYNKYIFVCNMINKENITDKFIISLENIERDGIYISFEEMEKEWKKLYGEEINLDKLINDISDKFSIPLKKKKNNKDYIFITGVDGLGGQDYKIKPTKITENDNNINVIFFDVVSLDFGTFKETGNNLGTAEIEYDSTNNTLKSIIFHKK